MSTPSASADPPAADEGAAEATPPDTGAGGCSGRVAGPDPEEAPNANALDMGDSKRARCTQEDVVTRARHRQVKHVYKNTKYQLKRRVIRACDKTEYCRSIGVQDMYCSKKYE